MTDQELDILIKISKIFENPEDKESIVMKYYIENFVNILSNGKNFFNSNYHHFENTVKWFKDKIEEPYNIIQYKEDEKKFFEPNTYQIVLNFKGNDLERVLLDFYKKYPDLKEHFDLIQEVKGSENISNIMEQKLLLESLHLANVEYYEKCIKQGSFNNVVNESLLDDIKSFIGKIRNRLVVKNHKNETSKNN